MDTAVTTTMIKMIIGNSIIIQNNIIRLTNDYIVVVLGVRQKRNDVFGNDDG